MTAKNLKDIDPKAKSYQEYRDYAGVDEGMAGLSTRFAFKILSKVFNYDHSEVAANPVHLLYVIEQQIEQEQFPPGRGEVFSYIKGFLAAVRRFHRQGNPDRLSRIVFRIRSEHFRSLRRLCRLLDPGRGLPRHGYRREFDRAALNEELEKIEKPAGISNPKDFRNEIVNFVLRARAQNNGKNPHWTSYEKLREVIEKKMFSNTEDLLPVISFNPKSSSDDIKKHQNFVRRMMDKGYTEKQVRLLTEWYLRVRKSS